MSLFPTPTRLALLRDIAAGNLRWSPPNGFTVRCTAVNARIDEFDRAGWIEITNVDRWQHAALTAAGRAVLDAADADREHLAAEAAAEHFHLSPGDLKGHRS